MSALEEKKRRGGTECWHSEDGMLALKENKGKGWMLEQTGDVRGRRCNIASHSSSHDGKRQENLLVLLQKTNRR